MLYEVTSGQIRGFVYIANRQWGIEMAKYSDYCKYGDKASAEQYSCFYMIGSMIDTICRYEPNNCLTYEQVFSMMQYVAKRLGFNYNLNNTPSL